MNRSWNAEGGMGKWESKAQSAWSIAQKQRVN